MIDLYCERIGAGLRAEPLNVLTNLAFVVAAFAAYRTTSTWKAETPNTIMLVALIASVGVGSALFHTFATTWARALDILPILAFQALFLWTYLRLVAGKSRLSATAAIVGLVIASKIARSLPHGVEWSLHYLPGFGALLAIGVADLRAGRSGSASLLAAAGLFAVSVGFRTIDGTTCSWLPIGTHFLWHLMNAAVLYLAFRGLVTDTQLPHSTSVQRSSIGSAT